MTQVLDGLFVSGLEESFDFDFMNRNGITHILNVASEIELLGRLNRNYAKYGIDDDCMTADIKTILEPSIKFITDARFIVLRGKADPFV